MGFWSAENGQGLGSGAFFIGIFVPKVGLDGCLDQIFAFYDIWNQQLCLLKPNFNAFLTWEPNFGLSVPFGTIFLCFCVCLLDFVFLLFVPFKAKCWAFCACCKQSLWFFVCFGATLRVCFLSFGSKCWLVARVGHIFSFWEPKFGSLCLCAFWKHLFLCVLVVLLTIFCAWNHVVGLCVFLCLLEPKFAVLERQFWLLCLLESSFGFL